MLFRMGVPLANIVCLRASFTPLGNSICCVANNLSDKTKTLTFISLARNGQPLYFSVLSSAQAHEKATSFCCA